MRRAICKLMLSLTVIIAAIALGKIPGAGAQEQPPNLRMLLNLDLFGRSQDPATGANPQASPAPSMLEQIRTLRAMGYLGRARKAASSAMVTGPPPAGNAAVTPVQPDDRGVPPEGVPQL